MGQIEHILRRFLTPEDFERAKALLVTTDPIDLDHDSEDLKPDIEIQNVLLMSTFYSAVKSFVESSGGRWSDKLGNVYDMEIEVAGGQREDFYVDTDFAVVFKKSNKPVCLVGFERRSNALVIEQLQAVRENASLLVSGWERTLVGLVVEMAEDKKDELSIEKVCIVASDNIPYVYFGKIDPERARLRYDVTARRMRFNYSEGTQMFERDISR